MMAFLVDTNVVSELRRKTANEHVLAWQSRYDISEFWVSVLTMMEIRDGTERIRNIDPSFAKKLDEWYYNNLLTVYSGRILPVTLEVCEIRSTHGTKRTLPFTDGLIGATAKVNNLALVTRNVKDFQDFGISLINPWEYSLD